MPDRNCWLPLWKLSNLVVVHWTSTTESGFQWIIMYLLLVDAGLYDPPIKLVILGIKDYCNSSFNFIWKDLTSRYVCVCVCVYVEFATHVESFAAQVSSNDVKNDVNLTMRIYEFL